MSSWVLHGHNLPALFEVVVKILNGHVVQRSSWTGGTEPFLPWAPMPAVAAQSPSYSPWPLWLRLDAQSDLLLRFHWRCWVEGAGNHNDRCPRAESKTVFIMYCTSAITLSFFGWAACWENSVRHHPDTFFSKAAAWFSLSCVRARGRLLRCMRPQIQHGYESMKCNWHEFYTTAPQLCEFDASAACLQPLFQHSSPLLGGVLTAKHVLTINCRTWPYRHPVSIPGHSCLTLWKIHENPQQEKQMQNPSKIWSFRKSDWFWGRTSLCHKRPSQEVMWKAAHSEC